MGGCMCTCGGRWVSGCTCGGRWVGGCGGCGGGGEEELTAGDG